MLSGFFVDVIHELTIAVSALGYFGALDGLHASSKILGGTGVPLSSFSVASPSLGAPFWFRSHRDTR